MPKIDYGDYKTPGEFDTGPHYSRMWALISRQLLNFYAPKDGQLFTFNSKDKRRKSRVLETVRDMQNEYYAKHEFSQK